jgi:methyltransferase (TIGR00027 family)
MSPAQHGISKTAIWVAAARAIGAREPDPAIRNPDNVAELLLGEPAQLGLDHPVIDALGKPYETAMQEVEVASTVRAMTERTRFIDQALERAVSRGITQCLIVGAGYDSRAWRYRELLAPVRVFELDRPLTSAFKRSRVAAALGGPPANLTYVAVDLEHDALPDALARHGYDPTQPTFVIMEGVTMYVQEDALRATFGFFARHAPGTSVVFDFATRAMIDGMRILDIEKLPPAARSSFQKFQDMIRNEPWVFGMPMDTEKEFLAGMGLALGETLTVGSEDSVTRYLTRADGTTMGAEAFAKVEAMRTAMQERMTANLEPEQRERTLAVMRQQARQNAYRIAEALVAPAAPPPPPLEFAFELRVTVADHVVVGAVAHGERRIVPITGGTMRGPLLKGVVEPNSGADWQVIRPDGFSELDTRYTLRTEQDQLVYVQNVGMRHAPPDVMKQLDAGQSVDPGLVYFRTMPRFETAAPELQWLTRSVFVGVGERLPNEVILRFYRVT